MKHYLVDTNVVIDMILDLFPQVTGDYQRCQAPPRPVGLRALRALAYDHNTPPPLA